ncbi:MAG TPA: SRPBCC family protein [Longimicrobium sp.]|jgi:uncharacterized protein YndB with AHSA1/START domain|nr:SRPBCC family protein [Longimicrobium sp.]
MLKKIGLGVLALIAVLLVVIATRPAAFRIERSATIAAPAEVVYAQIGDFHRWDRWNPFEKGDTAMRKTYEGTPAGVGASYHYVSPSAGEGRMTLTALRPHERIDIRAEFIKPFAATNQVEFTLKPAPRGVTVTWAMSGRNPFLGKAISLFVNMDRMVGGQFEQGLADLKRLSEAEAGNHAASVTVAAR